VIGVRRSFTGPAAPFVITTAAVLPACAAPAAGDLPEHEHGAYPGRTAAEGDRDDRVAGRSGDDRVAGLDHDCGARPPRRTSSTWQNRGMPADSRRFPPPGVLLFLGYGFLILAVIGVSLRTVVDQAIGAPISFPGLVVMILLAYTIFTITLVLQRKEAARGLAVGLSTLTVPLAIFLLVSPVPLVAFGPGTLGLLLWIGLRRPASRGWFSEP
jgi:hypothetical protein